MERNNVTREILIVGFALFAMFFGAGNLIFPTFLGFQFGSNWFISFIGFSMTGVCLPLLAVIAATKAGGTIEKVADRAFNGFGKIFGLIIFIFVATLYIIPRTGATTYEMAVKPLAPGISPIIVTSIYFLLNYVFSMNPSKVIERIGKILTPVLLISLIAMIIKGIFAPLGPATANTISGGEVFTNSFLGGYQTGDALGGLIFTALVVASFMAMGYEKPQDQIKLTYKASAIAVVGLLVIYGGLAYLGSSASSVMAGDIERTTLLVSIINGLLGPSGQILLGIIIAFACLSTSIGVTSATAAMFEKVANGKVQYKYFAAAISIFSAIVAAIGVETLVMVATPALLVCYPIAIAMIIMWLFDKYLPQNGFFTGAVIVTIIISIVDTLGMLGISLGFLSQLVSVIPLANYGFAWLIPAIVGGLIGYFFSAQSKDVDEDELLMENAK